MKEKKQLMPHDDENDTMWVHTARQRRGHSQTDTAQFGSSCHRTEEQSKPEDAAEEDEQRNATSMIDGEPILDEEGSSFDAPSTNSSTSPSVSTITTNSHTDDGIERTESQRSSVITVSESESENNNGVVLPSPRMASQQCDDGILMMKKQEVKNLLAVNDLVYEQGQNNDVIVAHQHPHHQGPNNRAVVPGAVQVYDQVNRKALALASASSQHYEREKEEEEDTTTTTTTTDTPPCPQENGNKPNVSHLPLSVPHPPSVTRAAGTATTTNPTVLVAERFSEDDVIDRVVERFQHIIPQLVTTNSNETTPIEVKPVPEDTTTTTKRRVCIVVSTLITILIIGLVVGFSIRAKHQQEQSQGYCNWNNCNGEPQGGDWCNLSQENCEVGCYSYGVQWCKPMSKKNADAMLATNGYCNWNNCNGEIQGGDWCNQNKYICEVDCYSEGVKWCEYDNSTKENMEDAAATAPPSAHPNPNPNSNGYCNWDNCNGTAQGGDWCNQNKENCEVGCYSEGVTWCENSNNSTDPGPVPTGYCNWNGCNGEVQGGDWCNQNKDNCEVGCYSEGVQWCYYNYNGTDQNATSGENASVPDGYCNWNGCDGEVQGGDWCNMNKESCEVSCYSEGVRWCYYNDDTDQNATTGETAVTPSPSPNGYCNWNGCDGEVQGGDWCNVNKEACELGCYSEGVKWCETTSATTPPPTSEVQYCGNGNVGNGICQDGSCCSDLGWCGISEQHCRGYTTCGNGIVGNGICVDSSCCSQYGYCGITPEHCGGSSYCGDGVTGNGICADGTCCSQWGYCGTTEEHCQSYCGNGNIGNGICIDGSCCSQSGYCEACGGEVAPSCGDGIVGNGICADGTCCSQYGYCGTTAEYCGSSSSSTRLNGNRSLLRRNLSLHMTRVN